MNTYLNEIHRLNIFNWSRILTREKTNSKFRLVSSLLFGLKKETLENNQFFMCCSDPNINDIITKIENYLCLE